MYIYILTLYIYIYIYIYIYVNLYIYIYIHWVTQYIYIDTVYILTQYIRGSLNKFPDFFHMGTFIDRTHMKL